MKRSKALLKEFKPDVVIGTGGYVCGPVVYAAAKLGIPTMIHEQNAIPGLTNQFLSRYADTVAVSFEGSESSFPKAKERYIQEIHVRQRYYPPIVNVDLLRSAFRWTAKSY